MTGLRFSFALIVIALCMLGGCTTPAQQNELPTSSDQTDLQKRAHIRLQLAMEYYEQRQFTVALDQIKMALQSDANFSDAYNVRGLIYMEMGETRLADDNFQHAIRLEPNNPDLSNNYGWFLCQSGQAEQSIAYFEAAIKNRAYQSPAKALNNAGSCSMKLKKLAAAESYFLQSFKLEPGNPQTSFNLARVFYERGDTEQARFYMGRVLKAEVMNPDVLWLAIKIEHRRDDKIAEASLGAQLRRRHPNSPEYVAYQRGAFDE